MSKRKRGGTIKILQKVKIGSKLTAGETSNFPHMLRKLKAEINILGSKRGGQA